MAATLKDIAEEAGFSIGTVSKVLNARRGADAFSKECVQAIRKAARKLGYRPNYHARSLQGGRSQTIGVLMGHLDQCSWDHFWAQMIGGIMVRARTMGYHSLTVGEVREADPLDLGLRFLQERRIDALIVPPYVAVDDPCEFEKLPGPVVRADYTAGSDWPTVALDEAAGIRAAVEHLAELGHRRLMWAGPKDAVDEAVGRRRGAFRDAVAELGVEGELVTLAYRRGANSEFFSERVAVQTGDLLEKLDGYPEATGFVCYEESTALAVYAACSSLGLRVPDDVSVIGFDDIYAQAAWPPMTVVSHMLEALGRRSAELAVAMLEPDAGGGREVGAGYCETVRAELVLRQSTAPPPDQA